MTPSPDAPALPDEDRLDFPSSWERLVTPTRTTGKPRKVALDPEAGRQRLAEEADRIAEALAFEPRGRCQTAGTAFLAGDPDPLGAAAVIVLADRGSGRHREQARPVLHHLVAERGLAFAAQALAEYFTVGVFKRSKRRIGLHRMPISALEWDTGSDGLLSDLRSLLAVAGDDEYAAVVAALADRRDSPAQRFAVTLLVPDERDWADEVCAEHTSLNPAHPVTETLVREAVTTAEQLRLLGLSTIPVAYDVTTAHVAPLVRRLGADAAPVLIRTAEEAYYAGELKACHKALALLPSDEAVGHLADRLGEAGVVGFAMDAAKRFPLRALRAVAARLPGADAETRKRLAALVHADPVLQTALEHLDAPARDVLAPLFESGTRFSEADPADLPPLLAAPPWADNAPKRRPVVVEGLVPPPINRVVWAEDERQEWEREAPYAFGTHTDEDWRKTAAALARGELAADDGLRFLAFAPLDIAAPLVASWRAEGLDDWAAGYHLKTALARFGEDVSEQAAVGAASQTGLREALLPVANLAAARLMADGFARLKSVREHAAAWLDRHRSDAAVLLVPDALSRTGKRRTAAEQALHYLASEHGPELVRTAAARYGAEAAAAIEALTDVDPSTPPGGKAPRPGAWAAPALLPQVLLAGGERALPPEAVRHLVTVLAVDAPYAGVGIVAEACDRASLNRFSLALFELWLAAGAPSKDGWALAQLAHFADDHTVRVLAPLVAEWPGESQHHRAVQGLKILGAIGTEAAMRAVQGIADKARYDGIRWEAHDQVQAIADRLGLTPEQLADRLVPDFGLGATEALLFDYGPRTFTVAFDEQLKPYVTDGAGKPRKTLPRPGAKDDAETADDAYRRYTALKKELRTVAADLVKRLETAMVRGRTWSAGEFRRHFAEHALVKHLARRLVWLADHGAGTTAFRIAEDGSFGDAADDAFALPADAAVRLAHPVHLGPEIAAWAELLADYEILQPFPQLSRPVMAFTDEELATGVLERFQGVTVDVGHVLGLTGRGWHRSGPEDAGMEPGIAYTFPTGGCIVVGLEPGIYTGSVQEYPRQTLASVRLSPFEDYRRASGGALPAAADPVAASEALAGLARLAAAR
ncbi:DUF4132 domain-containing protein [Glycomyces sp. A-F 0318]|uniref:DUF4132 domain-containing protein n=1 Tax=Glycomyces amatae TaxID=2881355 RepID=UPI001E41C15A|nr:DUF4132 domain-containing protein [Glycomyces amatae]MCD0444859.1 DUF4132 domain-containing protein [Glycomyces amatae]